MKQQRNTRQRQLVLDAVIAHQDHPSADQIYLDVRTIDDKISRATVYRNLNVLEQSGEILHVKVPSAGRFEARLDFHYHLLCVKCGSVQDLPMDYDTAADNELSKKTNYTIVRHRTVFEGICPECQKKLKEK